MKTKTDRLISPIVLLISTMTFAVQARSQVPTQAAEGKVIVAIRDRSVFSPSFAKPTADSWSYYSVFLKKGQSSYEMRYNGALDQYELEVPEGVYDVTLRIAAGDESPYQRANFFVRGGKTQKLAISKIEGEESVCGKNGGFGALPSDIRENDFPPLHYDIFAVKSPYRLVIKYCQKKITGHFITYKTVFLTYKNMTISATKGTLDMNTLIFQGHGHTMALVDSDPCFTNSKNVRVNLRKTRRERTVCKAIRSY